MKVSHLGVRAVIALHALDKGLCKGASQERILAICLRAPSPTRVTEYVDVGSEGIQAAADSTRLSFHKQDTQPSGSKVNTAARRALSWLS